MMNNKYSWDAIDEAAMSEGASIRRHNQLRIGRPVTKGDCRKKGMVRGCIGAKARMGTISVAATQMGVTKAPLGQRVRLAGLRETR
jgi:hypothetical protein